MCISAILATIGATTATAAGGAAATGTAAAAAAGTGISATTALSAAGVGLSAFGTITSYQASKKQADIQEQQMALEADRHRRSAYRDMLRSQAMSEVAGANAGALGGSGVMGGLNQAANSGLQSIRDTNQNEQLSHQSFGASRQQALGGSMQSLGSGLSSLGGAFVKNQEVITRVGRASAGSGWGSAPSIFKYN